MVDELTSRQIVLGASPITGVGGAAVSTVPFQGTDAGSTPSPTLQTTPRFGPKNLFVHSLPARVARLECEAKHYLGSYPGGALLNFGASVGHLLLGVAVIGVGPANLHRLFQGAQKEQVVCLARLWLDDRLGRNAESRTLSVILRHLRRDQTTIKALVAYSDPLAGHTGTIYRGAGFLYLGKSEAMPLYKLPDGSIHHSRSLSHSFGTHSRKHFASCGVAVELVEQMPKFIYVALIDPAWRTRLTRPALPYPSKEDTDADS